MDDKVVTLVFFWHREGKPAVNRHRIVVTAAIRLQPSALSKPFYGILLDFLSTREISRVFLRLSSVLCLVRRVSAVIIVIVKA